MRALSDPARHEYYLELCNGLPPPVAPSEKYREDRFNTAVEAFEALRPGDAYEGRLAVLIVLSGAHAAEVMREAGCYRDDFARLSRCRSLAASMMRAGASARRTLEREQRVRLGVEAVAETAPVQAAAARLPSGVTPAGPLAPVETAPASPLPVPGTPSTGVEAGAAATSGLAAAVEEAAAVVETAAVACSVPTTVAMPHLAVVQSAPRHVQAESVLPPSAKAIEKAERFASAHVEVAVRIRHDRGVTPQCRALFRGVTLPADPAVIDALVRGTSTLLTLMDDFGVEELDAAD